MSMRTPDRDHAGARVRAERSRALGRSRRSGEGSVTEMVRSLLREAREPGERRLAGARSPRSARFAPASGAVALGAGAQLLEQRDQLHVALEPVRRGGARAQPAARGDAAVTRRELDAQLQRQLS